MKQYMIGNAHIDLVWFWSWNEGYQEIKATFRSALDRLNENSEFIFTCACAEYYRWVEENEPMMFEEIKKRVSEGRWVIVGGMWIQPDMNTPCGESLVRQLLYGQRYFMERFGKITTMGYNVDSFGHNAMMPQIYSKSGISAYVWMRPGVTENPNIPQGGMLWEAPDGSQIYAYRIEGEYTERGDLSQKFDKMFAFSAEINQPVINMYGVGNHGGGPTIANIEAIKSFQANDKRGDDVVFASPIDYFNDIKADCSKLPIWSGELQHHASGCYSAHSRSKHSHRKTESAMLRQEKLGVLSRVLTNHECKREFIAQAWQNLMLCEFHDAMGGCCVEDVLDDIIIRLNEAYSIASREENAALQKLSWRVDTMKGLRLDLCKDEDWTLWGRKGQGTPVIVFNPHEFDATDTILISRPIHKVLDDFGNEIPVQTVRSKRTNGGDKWDAVFRATAPALGYRLYWVFLEEGNEKFENKHNQSDTVLENDFIRAEFSSTGGGLISLTEKSSGLNVIGGESKIRLMDISHCDIWGHNVNTFDKKAGVFKFKDIKLIENGPVRSTIRVRFQHKTSAIELYYTLYTDSDQLELKIVADINEKHKLIKLCIPTTFDVSKDIAEIPYGMLTRTASGEEEHCQRWCGLQGKEVGFVILNDGRYSYSANKGEIRITLANTSVYADHFGQAHRDELCRYTDQGELQLRLLLRPFCGNWSEQKLHQRAAILNQALPYIVETYHKGDLKSEFCGIKFDNDKIALGAFKRAEDDNGYVLRLQETTGTDQKMNADIPLLNLKIKLKFKPWEIKTLYLPDNTDVEPFEVQLTEYLK